MPSKIFLSPLRQEESSLKLPDAGRWGTADDFLAKYAADILIDGQVEDRQLIQSVPTVFARPIQFYQALENREHPAHASVVGQWRGLLAVFGLLQWLELSLDVLPFDLTASEAEPTDRFQSRPPDASILAILKSQLPHPRREWERWWLISLQGHLLGATSPWSLVYSPAESGCPAAIPWQKDGRLFDPITYFDRDNTGRSDELALLAAWLHRVMEHEKDRFGVADRPHLEKPMKTLLRELRAWQKELARYEQEGVNRRKLAEGADLVREPPYQHVLVPLDTTGLSSQGGLFLDTATEKVLVLSRKGVDPNKRVDRAVLAGQLRYDSTALPGPRGEAGWRTPARQEISYPYLIAEEAFFPPQLAEVALGSEAFSPGTTKFALPLTPLFFHYFTLSALLEGGILAEFSANDSKVTARLRLPLRGGDVLAVEKTYDRKTEVIQVEGGTPGLGFWPDFYDDEWSHNIALLADLSESNVVASPLLAGGSTLQINSADGSQNALRIWFSRQPILGFALATSDRGESAGVVVRRSLRQPQPRSQAAWQVGVDFGTSSTHLMVRDEAGSSLAPLQLDSRTVVLTEPNEANLQAVSRGFYPREEVKPPFPTLQFRNDGTLVGEAGARIQRDFYAPRYKLTPDTVDKLVDNLKWAPRGGGLDETPLREYLEALVRVVACEALAKGVQRLNFEWSYPLSLPRSTQHSMRQFWQAISRSFSIPSRLEITAGSGVSESEALCRHLATLESSALPIESDAISVAIDIGGGSSDIGFWTARRLLDQVSLKLAGNDVLGPLQKVPGLLDDLVQICSPGSDRSLAQGTAYVNILLTQARDAAGRTFEGGDPKYHPVPVALSTRLRASEPPWSVARSLIYLFASGLSFYAGLHARQWIGSLSVKSAVLLFGGRGSALMTWLAQGAKLEELLRTAFVSGLTLDQPENRSTDVSIYGPGIFHDPRSPLKSEVAQGLLKQQTLEEPPKRRDTTMLGEIGWYDSEDPDKATLPWDHPATAEQLRRLKPPPNHESGYAAHFLSRVVPQHVDVLGLDSAGLNALRLDSAKVQDYLRRAVAGDDGVLQPIFGVELKVLLEKYLERAISSHA
jgi:hypothetical protein